MGGGMGGGMGFEGDLMGDGFEQGGFGGPGGPGGPGGFGQNPNMRGGGQAAPEVPTDEEVTIWAHDLSAEPGATYRYKIVAAAINPLFRYGRVSEEQREANRDRVALAPSEEELAAVPWTPPVTLNPRADFFFLGGNPEQDRARVEVWKVFDGRWQVAEFEEGSGNGIGGEQMLEVRGQRQTVNLATGAILLDIDVQQGIDANPDQRLVFQEPDGRIRSRTRQQDLQNPRREQLQQELEEQNAVAAAGL